MESFKLVLDKDYYSKNDIISSRSSELRVISKPVEKYRGWFWKFLNYLTFGKRFNHGFTYTVEEL